MLAPFEINPATVVVLIIIALGIIAAIRKLLSNGLCNCKNCSSECSSKCASCPSRHNNCTSKHNNCSSNQTNRDRECKTCPAGANIVENIEQALSGGDDGNKDNTHKGNKNNTYKNNKVDKGNKSDANKCGEHKSNNPIDD